MRSRTRIRRVSTVVALLGPVRRPAAAALVSCTLWTLSAMAGNAQTVRGDGARQLPVAVPGSLQNPAFSPDDGRLVLTSFVNGYNVGPSEVHVFDLDSEGAGLLTSAPDSDSVNLPGTCWNGTVGRVTFSSDREDVDEVWTVADDGTDAFRVTRHTTQHRFFEPSYSPDGAWIVFEAQATADDRGRLWKVRADGTGLTALTDGAAGHDDRQPNFSPAGGRIVFQRLAAGSTDWNLYTMAEDGSDLRQVTFDPADDTDATWSPDGRWLVYSSEHGGLPFANLFIVPAGGGTPLRVTFDTARYDGAPSWSGDGRRIAFESSAGDPDGSAGTTLWLIDVPLIFADGFESGDTAAWSAALGSKLAAKTRQQSPNLGSQGSPSDGQGISKSISSGSLASPTCSNHSGPISDVQGPWHG